MRRIVVFLASAALIVSLLPSEAFAEVVALVGAAFVVAALAGVDFADLAVADFAALVGAAFVAGLTSAACASTAVS